MSDDKFRKRMNDRMKQLSQLNSRPNQPVLPERQTEEGQVYFYYPDRYILKNQDPSKRIYCNDTQISKEYSRMLREYANQILTQPEIFFTLSDGKGSKEKLMEFILKKI